jgi:hypothetical protein
LDIAGDTAGMLRFGKMLASRFGGQLAELIHTPMGFAIKNGQRVAPYAASDHYDHVHVALDLGRPGPGIGDGIGDAARSAAKFWRGNDLVTAVAVAGPESSYRDAARLVTSQEDSRGMWQVNTMAHPWARGMNLRDTDQAARAAHKVWSQAGGSWSPWTGYTSGGYRSFLSRARAAVSRLGSSGGSLGASGGGGGTTNSLGTVGGKGGAIWGIPKVGTGGGVPQGTAKGGASGLGALGSAGTLEGMAGPVDFIDAAIAQSALTPGTADDKAAIGSLVDFWAKRLAWARTQKDPRLVTEAATNLKSAQDQLGSIDDTLKRLADTNETLAAELKRQNDFGDQVLAVSSREALRFSADLISGEVSGQLSGRRMTAGTGTGVLLP